MRVLALFVGCGEIPGGVADPESRAGGAQAPAIEEGAPQAFAGSDLAGVDEVPGADDVAVDLVSVSPEEVQFGSVPAGTVAQAEVEFHNPSPRVVDVTRLETYAVGLHAGPDLLGPIAPWGTRRGTIEWAPQEPDLLGLLSFELVDELGNVGVLRVQKSGTLTDAAELEVSVDPTDGIVGVGCEELRKLTIANTGDVEMTVGEVAIDAGGGSWFVTEVGGEAVTLPFVVQPSWSHELELHFRPTKAGTIWGTLQISSDAFVGGVSTELLEGHAAEDRAEAEEFTASAPNLSTVLVAVNAEAVAQLEANLEGLLQALLDGEGAWRLALLTRSDGAVTGGVPYVDQTMAVDEAVAAAEAMLAEATGDDDALLEMLDAGLRANADWAADASGSWEGAPIHLVGINADQEQSSGSVHGYVDGYAAVAGSAHQAVVDAIAGVPPGGCSSGGLHAEPSQLLYDAAGETGGHFQSWCVPWEEGVVELAGALVSALGPAYRLKLPAAADTLVVAVDGVVLDAGWSFDEAQNALRFDADAQPPGGATIRVDYETGFECGGG